jgi:ubiquinone/menaquinone biosynthesis C-methylase UbiE
MPTCRLGGEAPGGRRLGRVKRTEDLIARTGVSGPGRLLDLACGTGQLAFPPRRSFAEVWAVDVLVALARTP